jgi:hypothetical protein
MRRVNAAASLPKCLINEMRAERRPGKVHDLDPLLFQRPVGRRITKSAVTSSAAGLRRCRDTECSIQGPRHHAATTWAKSGIPVQQGVRAMGWSSPAILKVYVDLAERDVAAAFGLGSKLTKKRTPCEFRG